MQTGTPKFDGISVADGTFDFLNATSTLTCRAAFIGSKTGTTHGWTNGTGNIWSPETVSILKALRDSMEKDLVRVHMVSDGVTEPGMGGAVAASPQAPGGLGEFLMERGKDAPPM